jgi:DNA-directed RNA polymerase specialized sigma24 family protein
MPTPDRADQSLQEFYVAFLAVTDPNSYCGRICGALLHAFIRRTLINYRLIAIYCERDILNETFIRGSNTIRQGKKIVNLQPWIRGTCLNVIREISRREQQTESYEDYEPADPSPSTLDLMAFDEELTILQQKLQNIHPIDQIILDLKVVKGYSWDKVSQMLETEGFGSFTVGSLRKRKERAMKRLRILQEE